MASIASSLQHIKDNPLILVGNETGTQLVFWGVRGKLPGMSRKARVAPGGRVYHVLNRSAGRTQLFRTDHDFLAFQRIMLEALDRHPMRLLAWCLMENHWHFVAEKKLDASPYHVPALPSRSDGL